MSLLHTERLEAFGHKLQNFVAVSGYDDAILDIFDEPILEPVIMNHAEKVAQLVRTDGGYLAGQMWAVLNVWLPNNRSVRLQASDKALLIHVFHTNSDPLDIFTLWDRQGKTVETFDVWDRTLNQHIEYYTKNAEGWGIPNTVTYANASRDFSVVLKQIEQVM